MTTTIKNIEEILDSYGPRFSGHDGLNISYEWCIRGFSAAEVDEWCKVGCWNPVIAMDFRRVDINPTEAKAACEFLIEKSDQQPFDIDPMYDACNNDINVSVIIAAHHNLVSEE